MITIEDLVPQNHFLRKLEAALDLSFVYCVENGLVSGRLAVTDSTHVKANASRGSEETVDVQEEVGNYWERLDAYEEDGLEGLEQWTGKRRAKRTKPIKKDTRRTKKRVSRTDPEAGHMKRPGKPRGQYYLSHQTLDSDHGFIIGLTVAPGDVHDSAPYLEQLEDVHKNVVPLQAAAADSAYDFPLAHRVLEELSIDFFVRPQPSVQRHLSRRWEPEYREALKQRQIWCEGTFAVRKWSHKLTRVLRRGLEAAEDHCLLSATALNLKRMVRCMY